jgi:ABC-type multidrug transport system ATPase subunit
LIDGTNGASIAIDSLVARAGRTVLTRVSLSWGSGTHAILGAREDGGPLLMATLAGRVVPRSGAVRVLGEAARSPGARRQVAHIPIEASLPDALRVDEVLALATTLRGEPTQDHAARLAMLGLEALVDRPVRSLLPGEVRAVALAEALTSARVRVVLLEEPFVTMDARAIGRLPQLLRDRAEQGAVVIVATASVGDASDLAQDHVLLRRGTLVRRGGAQDLLAGFWQDGNNARLRVVLRDEDDGRALAAALARQPAVVAIERLAGALCARGRDAEALARAAGHAAVEAGVDVAELRFDPPSLDEARARTPLLQTETRPS